MARRIVAALAALLLGISVGLPTAALAAPGSSGDHAPLYYLSLGDSLSVGVQPITDSADMRPTADGYADRLFDAARVGLPNLRLVKLGCPGETTATMIAGGRCEYVHGSQLDEATSFLHAHKKFVAFVTIDIGFNDFPCQTDVSCVQPGVDQIEEHLPYILAELRKAAGPETPIVGMTIYDPFLGYWFTDAGRALAVMSVPAITQINDLLEAIYGSAGMPVADVEGAFSTTDWTPVAELGGIPRNVATICALTWICAPPPIGPNNHANAAGYAVIGQAFAAALGPAAS